MFIISTKKAFTEIFTEEYDFLNNIEISCDQVFKYKQKKYDDELLTLKLLCYYLGIESEEGINGLVPFRNKRNIVGENGKEQVYDNIFELNGKLKFVISVKGKERKGDLRDACLVNKTIIKFHNDDNEPPILVSGGKINAAVQDFARLENVKKIQPFSSVTIIFGKDAIHRKGTDWYKKLKEEYDYKYLFLENNHNKFFNEMELLMPEIKSFRKI